LYDHLHLAQHHLHLAHNQQQLEVPYQLIQQQQQERQLIQQQQQERQLIQPANTTAAGAPDLGDPAGE